MEKNNASQTMTELSDLSQSNLSSPTPGRHSFEDNEEITSMPQTPATYPYYANGTSSVPMSASTSVANLKSAMASSTGFQGHSNEPRYFHSRRIKKGEIEKPWTEKKDRKQKFVKYIPVIGIVLGLIVACILIWDGVRSVDNFNYCPVYLEDFSSGSLNMDIWTKEVEVGGFGNGEFEETTNTDENVFMQGNSLIIKPTLQDASLITKDNVINLLGNGCTGTTFQQCVTATNTTNGTIVQPVRSGRISTKKGASIKYGRVEVDARLPTGDWLWPAIWMLPVNNTYGAWPASGEIDIMESRGNNHTYPQGGNNVMSSTLHWGPSSDADAWYQTNYKRSALHSTYADGIHTFGLEWSEKYLFTFIDTRLLQVGYTSFSKPFWSRGDFGVSSANGSAYENPWAATGSDATPFDQDFYLILNVAVGGTNGWFDDGVNGKPWVDNDPSAKLEFWNAQKQWYPTWEKNGQMEISGVRIYQQEGWNGCTNGKKYFKVAGKK